MDQRHRTNIPVFERCRTGFHYSFLFTIGVVLLCCDELQELTFLQLLFYVLYPRNKGGRSEERRVGKEC